MIHIEKLLGAPSFRPICIEDYPKVEKIRALEGHSLSAHAFTSLFLWREELKLSICFAKNAFLVRFGFRGAGAFFFPCGDCEGKEELLLKIKGTPGLSFHYMRSEDREFLEHCMPGYFDFEKAREDSEYLYRRCDQIEVKGKKYKNLRAKIHKAEKKYEWKVIPLQKKYLEKASDVIQKWCIRGGDGDKAAAMSAVKYYTELGFIGVLLENEEGPQAVAMGTCITADTFDLHVTKTLLPNVDSYLKWELFQRLPESVQWINQEEDLGLPGLRVNKSESVPESLTMLWKGISI